MFDLRPISIKSGFELSNAKGSHYAQHKQFCGHLNTKTVQGDRHVFLEMAMHDMQAQVLQELLPQTWQKLHASITSVSQKGVVFSRHFAVVLASALKALADLVEKQCEQLCQLCQQVQNEALLSQQSVSSSDQHLSVIVNKGPSPGLCFMSTSTSDPLDVTPARELINRLGATGQEGDHMQHGYQNIYGFASSTLTSMYGLVQRYKAFVHAALTATDPIDLQGLLVRFYHSRLDCLSRGSVVNHQDMKGGEEDMEEEGKQELGGAEMDEDHCSLEKDQADWSLGALSWEELVTEIRQSMEKLGMSSYCEDAVTTAVYKHAQASLKCMAAGSFDSAILPQAKQYIDSVSMPFLRLALSAHTHHWTSKLQESWQLRLSYLMYERLCSLLMHKMFDIIVDYPDSMPVIQDVASCLQHTSQHSQLTYALRSSMSRRLLHVGASASSIIHTYLSTIKALTFIQNVSGGPQLLPTVAEPIRQYLRTRPDAIKCLVSMITDAEQENDGEGGAGGSDEDADEEGDPLKAASGLNLLRELQKSALAACAPAGTRMDPDEEVLQACMYEKELQYNTPDLWWGMSPAAAAAYRDACIASLAAHSAHFGSGLELKPPMPAKRKKEEEEEEDIIGTLVGVFGSVDVFIQEYRSVLCKQLLWSSDYDCDRSIKTTELLKMRFGETVLHACEVMLKDMADSRRVNSNIHAAQQLLPMPSYNTIQGHEQLLPMPSYNTIQGHEAHAVNPQRLGEAHAECNESADPMCVDSVMLDAGSADIASALDGPSSIDVTPPAEETEPVPFSALIMSHLFWPMSRTREKDVEAKVLLPTEISVAMQTYGERYTQLKTPRKLTWQPHRGMVELEVSVGGVNVALRVSPVLATLLLRFRGDEQVSAAELAQQVGLPHHLVRHKMSFWVHHGLVLELKQGSSSNTSVNSVNALRRRQRQRDHGASAASAAAAAAASSFESYPVYRRAPSLDPSLHGSVISEEDSEEEIATAAGSSQDMLLEVMRPYENYISGMLTNYKQLPLDRLHKMLQLFVISPKYDKSVDQLGAYMAHLVSVGKVALENNQYKKPPAPRMDEENRTL